MADGTLKVGTITTSSGSGTITLGQSGETISVPSGVTMSGMGKVLQVVQGSTTTSKNTTSLTYVDSNLSASITPSSSSNKILVVVNQLIRLLDENSSSGGGGIQIVRDSTAIYGGEAPYRFFLRSTGSTAVELYQTVNLNYLDTPSTASAVTYKTQIRVYQSGDTVIAQDSSLKSTITLMEIAG